jgi:hypothetical protein
MVDLGRLTRARRLTLPRRLTRPRRLPCLGIIHGSCRILKKEMKRANHKLTLFFSV